MLVELRGRHPEVLDAIRTRGEISDETEKTLVAFLDDFARTFA
jgi:hypothetical protein